jgi:hypothetical protein
MAIVLSVFLRWICDFGSVLSGICDFESVLPGMICDFGSVLDGICDFGSVLGGICDFVTNNEPQSATKIFNVCLEHIMLYYHFIVIIPL